MSTARVVGVSLSATHSFSKAAVTDLRLLEGRGVEGDAHCGVTVKHRSRVAVDPTQPNLRQVHLMHAELFDELRERGFVVQSGSLGENITTRGIALLDLPAGAELSIGETAVVRLTGLRNPCSQIDAFQPGLLPAVLGRTPEGALIRKAGVMGVVLRGGKVCAGDRIAVTLPAPPHRALERV